MIDLAYNKLEPIRTILNRRVYSVIDVPKTNTRFPLYSQEYIWEACK